MVRLPALLLVVTLLAACTSGAPSPGGTARAQETPGHPPQTGALPGISDVPAPAAGRSPVPSTGWEVTVYYTAVADLHGGASQQVTGCPTIDCRKGRDQRDLGTFPASFVKAVKDEGTGRTADGRYLNWSYDTGYWMDTAPRDTAGRPLVPWVSAAADGDVLPAGTRFSVLRCGTAEVTAAVCARLKAPTWTVVDEFTPGLGGSKHVDVYIGEETGPGFTGSDLYTTLDNATLSVLRA
ncbi:hypothetical protein Daura_40190 [Dactylosporangium aurantiacum]|uniref:Lipoprotein n=1 Tax=Dactylosporangium aurantiacum TaxID=35754 RepID=A0A9Q9IG65_9ACTN|nr:hypothetical protein [Dactylosporangium aurantiacum]MDG6101353.1 hypothetical protein [Dactylosporangium aurantiacum]UWZ52789.1 hypothetical protein Daura_40190 [Dactylosporangium aurantiacum]